MTCVERSSVRPYLKHAVAKNTKSQNIRKQHKKKAEVLARRFFMKRTYTTPNTKLLLEISHPLLNLASNIFIENHGVEPCEPDVYGPSRISRLAGAPRPGRGREPSSSDTRRTWQNSLGPVPILGIEPRSFARN